MASLTLTPQQQAVVENRGGSLLVSAAAGSGKTKVLVERLFRYVTQERCNVDDFLIITYTKAAAAELRGKIAAELSKRLGEDPGDAHLRRQLLRVYQADIKTVDAFCTALLRENTHLLAREGEQHALTPDFKGGSMRARRTCCAAGCWSGRWRPFMIHWTRARSSWRIRWAPDGTTAPWRSWCWRSMKSFRAMRTGSVAGAQPRELGRPEWEV